MSALSCDVQSLIQRARSENRLSAPAEANLSRWLTEEPYRDYRPLLEGLIREERFPELEDAFWEVLPFGTGGRRGRMAEFGTSTLNPRTVAESAAGIASYLRQTLDSGGQAVVAFDTRLRSEEFARITACVFAARGMRVWFFDSPRATPELSFAVRALECEVGVMITASHNPPSDNGIKAYWSNGGQVLPPHDAGIIAEVERAGEIATVDFSEAVRDGRILLANTAVDDAYVQAVAKLSLTDSRDLQILYSPLHGVGETSVARVLRAAGFRQLKLFAPHSAPDGRFPNVPGGIANPENPAVFDLIIASEEAREADLILASDPDADRIGAVVRTQQGEFLRLSGNRIGALITDYVIRARAAQGGLTHDHYVVETLVTTPLVASIARSRGVRVIEDLPVGCKYIADEIDRQGPDLFLIGCEESHGYLAGDQARDKDAAVGALFLAESAAELRRDGLTLIDRLNALHCEHGYVGELQFSLTCPGAAGREQSARLVEAFQKSPPSEVARIVLDRVRDYGRHEVRRLPENDFLGELERPHTKLLIFEGSLDETRFTFAVRPSGTEPKIKFYLFAMTEPASPEELPEVERSADAQLASLRAALEAWMRQVM